MEFLVNFSIEITFAQSVTVHKYTQLNCFCYLCTVLSAYSLFRSTMNSKQTLLQRLAVLFLNKLRNLQQLKVLFWTVNNANLNISLH